FSYTESTTRPPTMGRYNGLEWFAQDSYKVNRRLVLDLGLRFAYSQAFHPPDNKEAGFNPTLFNSAKAVSFYTAANAPVKTALGFKTVFDLSYVGNLGRHLWWQRNVNSIPAGTVNPFAASNPDQFYRPYAGYLNITMNEFAGSSNYNALQASLNRRFSRNV